MDAEDASGDSAPAWEPLIDVTQQSVTELLSSGDTVLARSVQRLIRSLEDPNGVISAFQSYTSTPTE